MANRNNSRLFIESFLKNGLQLSNEAIENEEIQRDINEALENGHFGNLKNSAFDLSTVDINRKELVRDVFNALEDIILANDRIHALDDICESTAITRANAFLKYFVYLLIHDLNKNFWPWGPELPPFYDYYHWLLHHDRKNIGIRMREQKIQPRTAWQYINDFSGTLDILGHNIKETEEYKECQQAHKQNRG